MGNDIGVALNLCLQMTPKQNANTKSLFKFKRKEILGYY